MTDLLLQPMVIVDGQIVGGIAVFGALQNHTTPWLWACCGMRAAISLPTTGTIPEPCNTISATRTSSTPSATPSSRPIGSRTSGEISVIGTRHRHWGRINPEARQGRQDAFPAASSHESLRLEMPSSPSRPLIRLL